MSTKYIFQSLLFLSIIMLVTIACKKETTEDPPPPPECSMITPEDSAVFQMGSLVSVEAAVSGLSDQAIVIFSVDSIQMIQVGQFPYAFILDTEVMDTGWHKLRADAGVGLIVVSDAIDIYIIDTIVPPQAPVPVITIIPEEGTTDTIFVFDASNSYDLEDPVEDLLFRWDFEGDGEWDTDFSNVHTYEHKYTHNGHYQVSLEVMDTDTMSADTIKSLLVAHSFNPDPCEGIVSIPYGGKVYHTVPVGTQCWLRENLDIGEMIPEVEDQGNNQLIEKYCYNNDSSKCEEYGGLYMWNEAMNYIPFQGGRGICPVGFHIPSDEEWKVLEGYVDSQYAIDDPEWENTSWRGNDAGKRLKALLSWISGGNGNNIFGFKTLAAGYWEAGISFMKVGEESHTWSSTHDSGHNAIKRGLKFDKDGISRSYHWDEAAISVRCLRD